MTMQSLNNNEYVTFDYSKFNEQGLKTLIRAFKTQKEVVASVSASNKQRRVNGLPQKMAVLAFQNGQAVTIKVGIAGDIVEVKLNATILPIKNKETEKSLVREIVQAMRKNQDRFDKSQAKKLAKIELGGTAIAKTTGAKTLATLVEDGKTLDEQIADLQQQINETNIAISELDTTIVGQDSQISQLLQQIENVKNQLDSVRH